MNEAKQPVASGTVVEEESRFTLLELCQAIGAAPEDVSVWVLEGVLQPVGQGPQDWYFAGTALRRARMAMRLARDLEVNAAGVALALDLIDEIAALKSRLYRMASPPI